MGKNMIKKPIYNAYALMSKLGDALTVTGLIGKKRVKVWCIDVEHTNPYKYAKSMNWGDQFSEGQIETLREIGTLKPICEYDGMFSEQTNIPISFTSNALVPIEILPIG